MSILVVCPGCRKSFNVSDKFAGKSGPCPNCKKPLQVPAKAEEVKVHAPENFAGGGKSTSGKLVTKPVAWSGAKVQPTTAAIIAAASLTVLALTWIGGRAHLFDGYIVSAFGLLVVSGPLVLGGYVVLRNDELEPYRGKALYLRTGICALSYAILWAVFAFLAVRGVITGDLWAWLFVAPPFVVMGSLMAFATLDLDFGDAVSHYGFYLLVTVLLHRAAGMKWIWEIATATQ